MRHGYAAFSFALFILGFFEITRLGYRMRPWCADSAPINIKKQCRHWNTPSRRLRDLGFSVIVEDTTVISWVHSMAFIAMGQEADAQ
jgi:hypothetical protein